KCPREYRPAAGRSPKSMRKRFASNRRNKRARKTCGPEAVQERRAEPMTTVRHRRTRTKNLNGQTTDSSGILALGGFMTRKPWLLLMALFGALALVSCTGAKSDSNSEIVIGEFGSLTGTT